ncbi:hypothetical protein GYA54_01575 [Candidatus Kuenenbacteria bacterium]|nr:hypothetical protein [Candidatus Kuenenbacteria bacterium]
MAKEGENISSKIIFKWLLITAVFLIVAVVLVGGLQVYGYFYKDKIYPGVIVGRLELGGKTREQARVLLQAQIDKLAEEGQSFEYLDNKFQVNPVVYGGAESGVAYELWSYDLERTISGAYGWGRGKNFWQGMTEKIRTFFGKNKVEAEYKINSEGLIQILKKEFGKWEMPGNNAKIFFDNGVVKIEKEKEGRVFDYSKALISLGKNLGEAKTGAVKLELVAEVPSINTQEAEMFLGQVDVVVDSAPVVLYLDNGQEETKEWKIKKQEIQEWLELKKNQARGVHLGFNDDLVKGRLKKIAEEIDRPAKEARFLVAGDRVQEFQNSQDGEILDIENTTKEIENKFFGDKNTRVALVMKIDKAKIDNESVNNLGIKELIGSGASDFSGSPVNRRHNISVGAGSLNGILIKPEEEFSLLSALGEINAESGYKPELVIKEGKTIPEFGGGLCQIGTTLFRLAINTGLPITERRNHSYRVSYYEPAGTDATIYDPWPDFKFINDTGNYLLLQTKVDGNKLFFDFWGTRDGRSVATTSPVIYNIVKPGETKIIESEDLKPGEKKCTEKPHNGADAYFKRNITWPEGIGKENSEETFRSHYVPWSEVCLVGKAATSTAEIIEAQ